MHFGRYGKTTKSTDPIHVSKYHTRPKVPPHIQKLCTALALFVLSAQRVPHAVLVPHAPCIVCVPPHKQVLLRPAAARALRSPCEHTHTTRAFARAATEPPFPSSRICLDFWPRSPVDALELGAVHRPANKTGSRAVCVCRFEIRALQCGLSPPATPDRQDRAATHPLDR